MVMVMSTISNPAIRRSNAAGHLLSLAGVAVKDLWGNYVAWRIEQAAIAQLNSMSARALHDIGVARSQIEVAVKGIVDLERGRSVSLKY
jgi:uncharacterized protein YjiS (DUF1127 family)